jgi:hypothetical protein
MSMLRHSDEKSHSSLFLFSDHSSTPISLWKISDKGWKKSHMCWKIPGTDQAQIKLVRMMSKLEDMALELGSWSLQFRLHTCVTVTSDLESEPSSSRVTKTHRGMSCLKHAACIVK